MTIFDAAQRCAADGVPLLVIAGQEYGSESSRDWAAKGTALLGVRAVLASSYERIHRSNLFGMGVLPLQFADGEDAAALGRTGGGRVHDRQQAEDGDRERVACDREPAEPVGEPPAGDGAGRTRGEHRGQRRLAELPAAVQAGAHVKASSDDSPSVSGYHSCRQPVAAVIPGAMAGRPAASNRSSAAKWRSSCTMRSRVAAANWAREPVPAEAACARLI
jgi:hypothetical protein